MEGNFNLSPLLLGELVNDFCFPTCPNIEATPREGSLPSEARLREGSDLETSEGKATIGVPGACEERGMECIGVS